MLSLVLVFAPSLITFSYDFFDVNAGPGSFAERVRVEEKFAFKVPDNMKSTEVAPLLCAGCTVYRPLAKHCTTPGQRVLVVGFGGLGHLAVKMAVKLGAEVSVASRGSAKRQAALDMGAVRYFDSTTDKAGDYKVDLILYCASGGDSAEFLMWMRPGGTLVQLGAPPSEERASTSIGLVPLIFFSLNYVGSAVAGVRDTNNMLNFCSVTKIGSSGEVHSIDKLPEKMQKLHEDPKNCPFRFIFTTKAWDSEKDF